MFVEGQLDLVDGLALDTALAQGAEALKALGSTESLDVRRSLAAGELARHQLALDLTSDQPTRGPSPEAERRSNSRGERRIVLHVHVSEAAIGGRSGQLGRVDSRCDTDHVVPHAVGGLTCECNLAPLCRRHHRLKTHGRGWGYTVIEPGTYLWTSPAGYQLLRDHTGTLDVTHGDRGLPGRRPDGAARPPEP